MEAIADLRTTAAAYGEEPLFMSSEGRVINLVGGYIPLLANLTVEDKAAKGLRKRTLEDKPVPPIFLSALELVRDQKILLLSGPSGSGKTTFARHLAYAMLTTGVVETEYLPRNEHGVVVKEQWEARDFLPLLFSVHSFEGLEKLVNETIVDMIESRRAEGQATNSKLFVILDDIENAEEEGPTLIKRLVALIEGFDNIKLLLLGEDNKVKHWNLPAAIARHDILPLLKTQRQHAVSTLSKIPSSQVVVGVGEAAATPALFALAFEAGHCGEQAEDILDAWLTAVDPAYNLSSKTSSLAVDFCGCSTVSNEQPKLKVILPASPTRPRLSSCKVVQGLLAARHLVDLSPDVAIKLFNDDPLDSTPILRSLMIRSEGTKKASDLIEGLIFNKGMHTYLGALLASEFVHVSSKFGKKASQLMLAIIEQSELPAMYREKAGRVLSRLGDPRDLMALATVPAGESTLGSTLHSNSQPPARMTLTSFRIGLYPVVNANFASFVKETGRHWSSPDGFDHEKRNAPATDLTWYDAMAYCAWLTFHWRQDGKIGIQEHVRLPTEPEWERACRGDMESIDRDMPIYPWGKSWRHDTSNYEETGFNDRCSVGLFPKGRSPYGCHDMAGQVWEWCTTLWGEDMTIPSFRYPWLDDGREALDAPGSIRRVLRGGCFSSGRIKLCCTYRGSLEPGGSWRGNGFRIVVAQVPL